MRNLVTIVFVLFILSIGMVGCNEILTGIGIGAGGSEALDTYEEGLEAKRAQLDQLYDEAIAGMENAKDPNELEFYKKKAEQVQISKIANTAARTVVSELRRPDSETGAASGEGYLNLLHGAIPIVAAWGVNELRKRQESERKRKAEQHGRELALREIADMDEKAITAPVVKKIMYKDIGDALKA